MFNMQFVCVFGNVETNEKYRGTPLGGAEIWGVGKTSRPKKVAHFISLGHLTPDLNDSGVELFKTVLTMFVSFLDPKLWLVEDRIPMFWPKYG